MSTTIRIVIDFLCPEYDEIIPSGMVEIDCQPLPFDPEDYDRDEEPYALTYGTMEELAESVGVTFTRA